MPVSEMSLVDNQERQKECNTYKRYTKGRKEPSKTLQSSRPNSQIMMPRVRGRQPRHMKNLDKESHACPVSSVSTAELSHTLRLRVILDTRLA